MPGKWGKHSKDFVCSCGCTVYHAAGKCRVCYLDGYRLSRGITPRSVTENAKPATDSEQARGELQRKQEHNRECYARAVGVQARLEWRRRIAEVDEALTQLALQTNGVAAE